MDAKEFYELRKGTGRWSGLSRALVYIHDHFHPPHPFPGRNQMVQMFDKYVRGSGDILMLGSSLPPEKLKGFDGHKIVQIDLKKYDFVDIVADAERLTETFKEGSFDYVVSTSMLEHTVHPWKIIQEVFEVLKPGGVLYLSVPWIFPLHSEPHDYFRFSLFGIRSLVSDCGFVELESGSESSGHGALYEFLKVYFSDIFSFGNSMCFYAVKYVMDWILFPLGVVEFIFRQGSRRNYYTDAMVYIVAQKPSSSPS